MTAARYMRLLARPLLLCSLLLPWHGHAAPAPQNSTLTVCVDPDWPPFEAINAQGQHVGIAADLLALVAARTGLTLQLHPTQDWPESLNASRAGHCQALSFLNQTPARDAWLVFTKPILSDDNVLITREEHPFVTDLRGLTGQTMALPKGTSIEERVRRDFPNLKLIITDTEAQALALVSNRQADMTMRSLIMAAYTIKQGGWFNLKIAGQVPGYANQLRIGVTKDAAWLRDKLDQGVQSITPIERQQIIDRHTPINITTGPDYVLVAQLIAVLALVVLTSLFWLRKLNRVNAELKKNGHQLQHAKINAEQTVEQQRRLIAMLSHEIRTPVAVIDATAQVLAMRLGKDPGLLKLVSRIRRGAARLAYFFDNSLTADRLESDSFGAQRTAIDLAQIIADVKERASTLSATHHISTEVQAGLPSLLADPVLLRILLVNLLSNAINYSPDGSRITLAVQRHPQDGAQCWFSVEDQGSGIPDDELPDVFLKYRRGRNAEAQPGAGLGLFIVDRIAKLHGGTVSAEPVAGRGTRLVVALPFDFPENARHLQANETTGNVVQ